MSDFLSGRRVIRVDKVNGRDFVQALTDIWAEGGVAIPVEPGGAFHLAGVTVSAHRPVETGGGWITPRMPACNPDDPAIVSFTSGTTGAPKAILISHGALADVTARLVTVMQMDSSIREYVGVPVVYSFGAGRVRAIAEVAGSAFLPDQGFRADQFAQMLEAGEVNALSAVPSMLRILLAQQHLFGACGAKLRWMEIGSQYMAADEKQALRKIFPNARIVQHYGLTEASRSTFLVISDADENRLETVGEAIGGVEIRVDAEGLICIRGPHIAMGKLVDGRLEAITDKEGWLRTADLGRIEDGALTYLGRADDVANIAGIKVSADHFEQELLERSQRSSDELAVAVGPDAVRGERLLIGFTAGVDREVLVSATRQVAAELGLGPADFTVSEVASIPRTETGKVRRSALARMMLEPSPSNAPPNSKAGSAAAEEKLASVWSEILGIPEIGPDDSFFDLGGDSLSAVTVALRAEQEGLSADILHHMFEGRTLRQIVAITEGTSTAAETPATRRAQLSLSINASRGILVLMVIGAHWLPFFYDRMGALGAALSHSLEPVFHIGTPGFAIVFGVGLVFFYRPLMTRSQRSFRRKLRANSLLLGGGVLIQGLISVVQQYLERGSLSSQWPEQAFYTVILFYLLMVPTVGIWLRLIYRQNTPALNALLIAIVSGLFFAAMQHLWPLAPGNGWVRLFQHMLVAPYAYPLLLSAVCTGVALGVWMERNSETPSFSNVAAKLGIVLLGSGAASVAIFTDGWWSLAQTPAAFPAYAGAVTLIIAGTTAIVERNSLRMPIRLLAVVGLLAFPAFVAHGIVIPISRILIGLSLPYSVAVIASVGLFVAAAAIAIRKLYRMLFGGPAGNRPSDGDVGDLARATDLA